MSDKDDLAQDDIEDLLDGDHVAQYEIPDECDDAPKRCDTLAEIRELVILIADHLGVGKIVQESDPKLYAVKCPKEHIIEIEKPHRPGYFSYWCPECSIEFTHNWLPRDFE